MGRKRHEFDELVATEVERSELAAKAVRRQGRPRDEIDYRVGLTLIALVLWLFASMITPIPRLTDAGDEAAARILGFVAGASSWLLAGAIVHLGARRWRPTAGLTVAALGASLAAGSNIVAAVTPYAPQPIQATLQTHVGRYEVAIRNMPHMLREVMARPSMSEVGFASVPMSESQPPP